MPTAQAHHIHRLQTGSAARSLWPSCTRAQQPMWRGGRGTGPLQHSTQLWSAKRCVHLDCSITEWQQNLLHANNMLSSAVRLKR